MSGAIKTLLCLFGHSK